ncbi:neuropeptide FF receptor 2-like [Haliotis cracherodii]|uniref:neuropeptide FF receptor 2-like n=1 Tax=Haliotis cracherodii TaxID=6455 RepID=UPI0039E9AD6A
MEDTSGAEFISFHKDTNKPVIVVISVAFTLLIVLGNGLVLALFATKKEVRTPRNSYIAFLAITDVLVGVFIIPLDILHEVGAIKPTSATCKILEFMRYFVLTSNLYCVVAIAADRYRCIVHMYANKPSFKHVNIVISIIWLCAAVYAIREPFAYDVIYQTDVNVTSNNSSDFLVICGIRDNDTRLSVLILDFFVHFVIPLFIISCLYIKMTFWLLKQQNLIFVNLQARKRNYKVIKMVLLIVILYIVCQLPTQIWRVYVYTGNDVIDNSGYLLNTFLFLTYTNSWLNVVVYVIFNDSLLKRRQDFVPCCRKRDVGPAVTLSTMS